MHEYQTPSDTQEKEKVIGGLLTMAQGVWIGLGLVAGLFGFVLFLSITKVLGVGIFVLILNLGLFTPFAFIKKRDLTLFQYVKLRAKKLKQNPILLNTNTRGGRDR